MSATLSGATSPQPLPPAILAQRYRLERRLAQGGMAEVWLGTDLSLTRQVAVKLLKPNLASDPVVAERFRREAITVAQLNHPNIVAVYDAIEETIGGQRRQAVVMQLINGKSLRQLLDEQKKLSPELTMHIGSCVAAALDVAHRAELVHRDVKPANILITPDGRVLLTDFGIAKGLATTDDDLTGANVMMGTAKYLSPEQVRGKRLDGRADLYSLGLVLYECLAGRVPFLGETDTDTALARLNRDPTDIARLRPTLPAGLADLIHRLLARRPEQRYATGTEVRSELGKIASRPADITSGMTPPRGTDEPTPRRGTPVGPSSASRAPTAVGGYQPTRAGRPAGAPVRSDRTPPSSTKPRNQPNKKFEDRPTRSLVLIGLLLLIALVVSVVLWATVGDDDDSAFTVPTSAVPGPVVGETPLVAAIVGATTYDPDGDDPTENDEIVNRAIDGDPATAWVTLCYSDRYLGGKRGVGVVVDLSAATLGSISAVISSAPYQVTIATAGDGPIPTTVEGWTTLQTYDGLQPNTITATLTSPARYVLVMFRELGPDGGCNDNPFRGSITDISFQPAG